MAAVHFTPAESVTHTHQDGRQLDFSQRYNGSVFVKIHYGLSVINRVSEDRIFVQHRFVGLNRPVAQRLDKMSPERKKEMIEAVTNDTVNVLVVDGHITNVQKRNTIGDVFFRTVNNITLIFK
ncbi:MAG: hypothetical protein JSS10_00765 [Verrucomicrobia bacterium]|nr:hypothetical protein [Verrucomicrobiota bacterium]